MRTKFITTMLLNPATDKFVCGIKWTDNTRDSHPIMGREIGLKGEGDSQEEAFYNACTAFVQAFDLGFTGLA